MTTIQLPLSASRIKISSQDFNSDMAFRCCGVRLSGGGEAHFKICVILALAQSTNGFLSRGAIVEVYRHYLNDLLQIFFLNRTGRANAVKENSTN